MFDYLAVLILVVLGLAVTHTLGGVIKQRHHLRLDWLRLFWGLNVLVYN